MVVSRRARHPGAAQRLCFGEDQPASEGQRALHEKHRLEVLDRRREMRFMQKAWFIWEPEKCPSPLCRR
jgi:hypothetical protein